jgi:hypothetical protein
VLSSSGLDLLMRQHCSLSSVHAYASSLHATIKPLPPPTPHHIPHATPPSWQPVSFAKREMDLHLLFSLVVKEGGAGAVGEKKMWARIGRRGFNPPPSMTDLSFQIKKIYTSKLLEFEQVSACVSWRAGRSPPRVHWRGM